MGVEFYIFPPEGPVDTTEQQDHEIDRVMQEEHEVEHGIVCIGGMKRLFRQLEIDIDPSFKTSQDMIEQGRQIIADVFERY